jgi:hypothetical protein
MMQGGRMVAGRAVREAGLGRCGQPLAEDGREVVSTRTLLEWAFARERASLEFDEIEPAAPAVDSTRRIMDAMALSTGDPGTCLRIDAGGGRSLPHHDADVVASVLRSSVPWSTAVRVAELARNCSAPRWDIGPQRLVPRDWGRCNQYGVLAKSEICGTYSYRSRRRGMVTRQVMWTPVRVEPTASQIAAARRSYLDWWGALLAVMAGMKGVDLDLFQVSGALPPVEPWRKGG